jgi:hypothetical protein
MLPVPATVETVFFTAGLDNKIRVVHLNSGIIDTVAGTGVAGYTNGAAGRAQFSSPQRVQVDSSGNVYVADTDNSVIRRVDAVKKTVSTVAGTGSMGNGGTSGQATSFALATPRGLALEGDNTLYIADSNNQRIRKVNLGTGKLTTVAGSTRGFAGDGGPASGALFYQPRGLTVTPNGSLIVADTFNDEVRIIQ